MILVFQFLFFVANTCLFDIPRGLPWVCVVVGKVSFMSSPTGCGWDNTWLARDCRYSTEFSRKTLFLNIIKFQLLVSFLLVLSDQVTTTTSQALEITFYPSQFTVHVLGSPSLYWESFSDLKTKNTISSIESTGPLYGLIRTCIKLAPFTIMMLPTMYIYVLIMRVRRQYHPDPL